MKNGNLELIKEKDFLNCLLIFKIGGDKVININRKLECFRLLAELSVLFQKYKKVIEK